MEPPAFASAAQVDAVAATVLSNVRVSDADENVQRSTLSVLAVAQSQLEGNVWGGRVTMLQAATSEQLCELQVPTGVASMAWCGVDSDVLAMGCDDGDVRLARLSADAAFTFVPLKAQDVAMDEEEEEEAAPTGWGHDDVITGVCASILDKTKLVTCSWDLTVKLWDMEALDTTITTLSGHTDLIWGVTMNPMHAHVLCSASQDATVQVWDTRHPQNAALAVSTLCPALSVDWHPRQSMVFSVGLEDGMVCTFDVRSPRRPLARQETHDAAVHALKYSPYHDDLLATGGDDGKAFVTTDSFSSDRTASSGVRELLIGEAKSAPRLDYVRAVEWFKLTSAVPDSDDNKFDTLLATGSWDKSVRQWSAVDYRVPVVDELFSPNIAKATAPAPLGVSVA